MMDRFKESLAQVLRALLSEALDYDALYPAKVIAQDAQGRLDVRPDTARLPDLAAIPIRYGIPGVKATIAANARVLIGFEARDPRRPIAYVWESASVTKLEIDGTEIIFNGGNKKVARDTDPVSVGTLTGANAGGPVLFIYTPPGGLPGPPLAVQPLNGGKITDGAAGVKA
jgi:hypothetical protein